MKSDPLSKLQIQPGRSGDMLRRLQFGVGGVVVVLLLVGLAGIIGQRAADQAVTEATGVSPPVDPAQTASDQPLVDLGVQPANPEAAAAIPAPIQPGTSVPDLPADPARKNGQ